MGKWGTGKQLRTCNKCKIEFYARVDRKGLYCSRSCSAKSHERINHRANKNCLVCKKLFSIKRYRIETALYCSIRCRRLSMPKKENHHNWKGGISRTWHSKTIIKNLIKEMGRCEICSETNNLQGHHVVPYSENKNLRDDIKNIKILCIVCHSKQHPHLTKFILRGYSYE